MALSKTITARGSNGHHNFKLEVIEKSYDSTKSYLDVNFIIYPEQTGYDFYWGSGISYAIKIDVNDYVGDITGYNGYSNTTIRSISNIPIPHNSDGSKTITISFTVTDSTGVNYTCGNAKASASFTLTSLHTPPIIEDVIYLEKNSVLVNLGIENDAFVQYMSKKEITLNAVAYNGATITEYYIEQRDNKFPKITSTTNKLILDFMNKEIPYTYNEMMKKNVLEIYTGVKDSVGANFRMAYPYNSIIPYTKPQIEKINTNIKRKTDSSTNLTDNKAVLSVSATIYKNTNDLVGSNNNTVKIYYKIWLESEIEPTNYIEIPNVQIKSNKATAILEISNVDYIKKYKYKVKIIDTYNFTDEMEGTVPTGVSVWTEYKDRVDFLKITIQGEEVIPNGKAGDTARVWLSSEFSFSANTTMKIPFDEFETDNENYFQISDNGIKILKDCTVLVWLQWTTWGSYTRYAYIVLNNAEKESFTQAVGGTVQTMMILKCKANDIIYGRCHAEGTNAMSNNKNQSYMTATILR